MTNETFSFQRFWNYFKYDLTQLWRHNGLAVVMLGFISLIVYLVWVIFSVIFTGSWNAPGIEARIVVFFIGWIILVLGMTRTYGYLTQKRAGSAWLMVPASALEKFISMLIITLILMPLAFFASYMLIDGALALIDPTVGKAILASSGDLMAFVNHALEVSAQKGVEFNLKLMAFPLILQCMYNILYFLFCGVIFKKWKLAGAFAILVGIGMVSSLLFSTLALHGWAQRLELVTDDPLALQSFVNASMNYGTAFNVLVFIGLAVGIYYRIKTLKH